MDGTNCDKYNPHTQRNTIQPVNNLAISSNTDSLQDIMLNEISTEREMPHGLTIWNPKRSNL